MRFKGPSPPPRPEKKEAERVGRVPGPPPPLPLPLPPRFSRRPRSARALDSPPGLAHRAVKPLCGRQPSRPRSRRLRQGVGPPPKGATPKVRSVQKGREEFEPF